MSLVKRNDIIQHWGIPGQKWGIRNFQFPDNKWTELGKIRYAKGKEFVKTAATKAWDFVKNYHKIREKRVKDINNKITNNGKNVVAKFASDVVRKTSDRLSSRIAQEIEKMIFEKNTNNKPGLKFTWDVR